MATKTVSNKELNEKVDKLTEMFSQFMQNQQVERTPSQMEIANLPKRPGRPKKQTIVPEPTMLNRDVEAEIRYKKGNNKGWANSFVDERKEHLDDSILDKKLAVLPPVDKGVRKSAIIKSTCSGCQKVENVPTQFVMSDPETRERYHTCQKCLKSKLGK